MLRMCIDRHVLFHSAIGCRLSVLSSFLKVNDIEKLEFVKGRT